MSTRIVTMAASACLAAMSFAGCGSGGDSASTTTTTRRPVSTTTTTTTTEATTTSGAESGRTAVCPESAKVAEVMGGPVDRAQSMGGSGSLNTDGTSLSYEDRGCSFEFSDGADGTVSVTRVMSHNATGSFFDAAEAAAKADFAEDGMEPLDDLGEDAYRSGTDIVILVDGTMVFVSAAGADDEDSAEMARELAESILSEGSSLVSEGSMDCDALGSMAPESFGTLDSTGSSSGSILIDELNLETEGCHLEFDGGASGSVTVAPGDQWDAWVAAESNSMFTVRYTALEIDGHRAFDDGETLFVEDDEAHPLIITSEGDDLDADQLGLRQRIAELALASS